MKRKLDFITNSSSVSYVGWGVYLSKEDIENDKFLKKCFENYKTRSYANQSMTFEEFKSEPKEATYYLSKDDNEILKFSSGPCGDSYFIIGPSGSMKDEQTLKEFKDQIIKELSELGIKVDKLEYIEECWREVKKYL